MSNNISKQNIKCLLKLHRIDFWLSTQGSNIPVSKVGGEDPQIYQYYHILFMLENARHLYINLWWGNYHMVNHYEQHSIDWKNIYTVQKEIPQVVERKDTKMIHRKIVMPQKEQLIHSNYKKGCQGKMVLQQLLSCQVLTYTPSFVNPGSEITSVPRA